jgi:hypothetical protein
MLCHDPQRLTDRSSDAVVDLSGALTAATFQFATQLASMVHPLRHRRACHTRSVRRFTMRRTGEKRVDGDELRIRKPDWSGFVGNGHCHRWFHSRRGLRD